MSAIDQRIVEMRFENHLFEKNVATSISTLEKLKNALNFGGSAKGIKEVESAANGIDFSKISDSLDVISKRFTTMGIIGMTAIQNLTTSVMQLGSKLVTSVLDPIKSGGWSRATNIDKAKFQIEGLGKSWEDVKADVDYGVSDTAYGLDAAATAASQLIASGVEFGETFGETGNSPMAKALRGISGVAAMTNSSYEEIAHIFTTVAGQGKLMTMQLRQLELRGLNAAAKLGEVLGKTEEEIREMVTRGEIDFAKFSESMNEAFGDHAKEANKTFEGSFANMKAALARIGADFATPIRAKMIPVFNSLRLVFKNMKTDLGDLDKGTGIYGDFADFLERLSNIAVHLIDNFDLGWWKSLTDWVHTAYQTFSAFMSSVTPMWDAFTKAEEAVDGATEAIENFDEIVKKIIRGDYGNGEDRIRAIEEEFGVGQEWYERLQNLTNETLGDDYRYKVTKSLKSVEKQTEETVAPIQKLNNSYTNLVETIKITSSLFRNMFTEGEKEQLFVNVKAFVDGLVDRLDSIANIINSFVRGASKPLVRIVKNLITLGTVGIGTIGKLTSNFSKFLKDTNAFSKIENTVYSIFTKIANVVSNITSKGIRLFGEIANGKFGLTNLFSTIKSSIETIFDNLKSIFRKLSSLVEPLKNTAVDFVSTFTSTSSYSRIVSNINKIKSVLENIKDNVFGYILEKIESLKNVDIIISEIDVDKAVKSLDSKINFVLDKLSAAKKWIVEFFTSEDSVGFMFVNAVSNWFKDVDFTSVSGIVAFLEKIKDSIISGIQNLANKVNLEPLINFGKSLWELFKEHVVKPLNEIGTGVADTLEYIVESFTSFKLPSLGKILTTALGGTGIYTVWNAILALNGVFQVISGTGGIFVNAKKTLGSIKWFLRSLALETAAKSILTIAEAIGVLAISMKLLSSLSWDEFKVAAASIGVITLALGALLYVANRYKGRQVLTPIDSIATTLASLKWSFAEFLRKIGRGATMIAVATTMGLIVKIMSQLNDIDWADAKRSLKIMVGCVGVLLLALGGIELINKTLGNKDSFPQAVTIVALGASILLFSKVVQTLGEIKTEEAIQGVLATIAIVGMLSVLFRSARGMKGSSLPLMMVVSVVAALVGGLYILSDIKTNKLLGAAASLGIVLVAVAGVIAAVKLGDGLTLKSVGTMALLMVAITGIVAIISYLLKAMKGLNGDNVLKIAGAIDSILVAIGLLMLSTNKLTKLSGGNPGTTFLNGLAITGVITLWIGTISAMLSLFGWLKQNTGVVETMEQGIPVIDMIVKVFKKLILFMFAIGLVTKFLTNPLLGVGGNLEISTAALATVAEWLLGLGILFTAIGAVNEGVKGLVGSGIEDFIYSTAPILESLGNAIGRAIYGLMAGVAGFDSSQHNTTVAGKITELLSIIDILEPYMSGEKTINASSIEALGDVYMALAKAEFGTAVSSFFSNITSWFSGDGSFEKLGGELVAFAEALVPYSEAMNNVKVEGLTKTADAIKTVLEYSDAVPNTGGLLGMLAGNNDLAKYAEGLLPFARAMVLYSQVLSGEGYVGSLNTEVVEQTKAAVSTILEFGREAPNTGGLLGMLAGNNDLATYAEGLAPFAKAMVLYSMIMNGQGYIGKFDPDVVTLTSAAVSTIIEFSKEVPNSGGVLGFFAGENDMDKFGNNLVLFANAMVNYTNIMSGVEFGNTEDVLTNMNLLADLANIMYNGFDANLLNEKVSFLTTFIDNVWEPLTKIFNDAEGNSIDIDYLERLPGVLSAFGEAISAYWSKVKKVKESINTLSSAALDTVTALDLDKSFNDTYVKSVADAKQNLIGYAGVAHDISKKFKIFDGESATKAERSYGTVNKLSKDTTFNSTYIDSVVSAESNLIEFATKVTEFAESIKLFTSEKSVLDKADSMIDLIKRFDRNKVDLGEIVNSYFGTDVVAGQSENNVSIATRMVEYANLMAEYTDLISNIDVDTAEEKFERLNNFINSEEAKKMFNINDTSSLTTLVNTLAESFIAGFSSEEFTQSVSDAGSEIVSSLVAGLTTNEFKIDGELETLIASITTVFEDASKISGDPNQAVSSFGSTLVGTIIDTFTDNEEEISTTASNIVTAVVDAFTDDLTSNAENVGNSASEIITKIKNSIDEGEPKVTGSVNTVGTSMINTAESYYPLFRIVGKNIMTGLTEGMTNNSNEPVKAIASVMNQVLAASKKAVDSRSPSKKFIELGRNNMEGLAIGMTDNTSLVTNPAKSIGETLANTFDESMNKANNIVDEIVGTIAMAYLYIRSFVDDEIGQPVISPVLDLSNIRSGMGDINSLMDTTMLPGILPSVYLPMNQNKYEMSNYNQSEIVSSIRSLRSDIGTLGDAISKMQVLMNTGQVVGAITTGVDRELGSIQKYNVRWA